MENPFSTEFRPPRRLRVLAFDPTTARSFENRAARVVTISIPYEMDPTPADAKPDDPKYGPNGEYFEVIDYDPSSGVFYTPIDLNNPQVWLNDGLAPSAENPQFHQQMVYAVAMNTVTLFEEALGRSVQWAPKTRPPGRGRTIWTEEYVPRLRIYPHALREANAFYNPKKKALLFGYFTAPNSKSGAPKGTTVFTCLSHDIIVHETVHAILDGMHPRFAENSNPDMRALHEAFSDIVALFQLFSFPDVLEDQIGKTRGDLEKQSLLGELAQEFGQAVGRGHALRDFLGGLNPETKEWEAKTPDPDILSKTQGPHARGAVLVAAVFRAFLTIYRHRVKDLFRIASNGSGRLRDGEIDPDLKKRLAAEAAQCARRVLRICIRAMDYTPPVNVSFGSYLRAIITADHDLFPADPNGYRDAFIEAFSAWGVLPDMPVITEEALLWPTISQAEQDRQARNGISEDPTWLAQIQGHLGTMMSNPPRMLTFLASPRNLPKGQSQDRHNALVNQVSEDAREVGLLVQKRLVTLSKMTGVEALLPSATQDDYLNVNLLDIDDSRDREVMFFASNHYKRLLWLVLNGLQTPRLGQLTGLVFDRNAPATVMRSATTRQPSMHVAGVRIARRLGQRGKMEREYVVEVIQTRRGYLDPVEQLREDARAPDPEDGKRACDFNYRAGGTFLIDARSFAIRRLIRTPYDVADPRGLEAHRAHLGGEELRSVSAFYSGTHAGADQAFTDLHRVTGDAV
ncbi:MAG: hypothetical protein AAGA08_08735 [Pseudomonadota bacterium]